MMIDEQKKEYEKCAESCGANNNAKIRKVADLEPIYIYIYMASTSFELSALCVCKRVCCFAYLYRLMDLKCVPIAIFFLVRNN